MKQTKYDALAKVSMHGREHIVILRPIDKGIVLHTMYFVDELHQANENKKTESKSFDKKELEMAKKLVEALAGNFEPAKYHDEYKANVEHLIESKRKGQKVTPIKQPKSAPVLDLMQALQNSLKQQGGGKPLTAAPKNAKETARKAAHKRPAKVA